MMQVEHLGASAAQPAPDVENAPEPEGSTRRRHAVDGHGAQIQRGREWILRRVAKER